MIEDIEPLVGEFDRDLEYVLPDVCVTDDELEAALATKANIEDVPTKTSQIENDSSYVTSTYVDSKFEEAIKAGFKTEVVETLPTENISHQIIYLVPNEEAAEQNIHDEYVYTANNEWEKIGSTNIAVDKSYQILYIKDHSDKNEYSKISEFITNLYKNGEIGLVIFDRNNTNNKSYCFKDPFYEISPITKQNTSIHAYSVGGVYQQHAMYARFDGVWTDGVFELTKIGNGLDTNYSGALPSNNTWKFTPTGDYNPATKKYVDDAVANSYIYWDRNDQTSEEALSLWNEIYSLWKNKNILKQVYTRYQDVMILSPTESFTKFAFQCVNDSNNNCRIVVNLIVENDVVTKVISSLSVKYILQNYQDGNPTKSALSTENTKAYTPTNDYNPATKKYVDDAVASVGSNAVVVTAENCTSQEILDAVTAEWQKCLNNEPYEIYIATADKTGRAYFDTALIKQFGFGGLTSSISKSNGSQGSQNMYHAPKAMVSVADNVVTRIYNVGSGEFGVTMGSGPILTTGSTYSYTPTGDYNPATKKYVDDSLANISPEGPIVESLVVDGSNAGIDTKTDEAVLTKLSDIITKSWEKGLSPILYLYADRGFDCTNIYFNAYELTQTTAYVFKTNQRLRYGRQDQMLFRITGSWTDNVFTATSYQFTRDARKETFPLDANNSTAFEPTGDYNPATKKYVDDSVANLISTFGTTPLYEIDETSEISTADQASAILTDAINRANQTHSPKDFRIMVLYKKASSVFEQDNEALYISHSTLIDNSNIVFYRFPYYSHNMSYLFVGNMIFQSVSVENNNATVSRVGFNAETFKLRDFAKKSYVDTAINNALGDVNSVLATLTTVEEGE